jgi:hypothetical protein
MKKTVAALGVLLLAGAFLAGYWPQRQDLAAARAEAAETRRQLAQASAQLAAAEAKARLGLLFGRYLALEDAVVSADFGTAQALSTAFFDQVREEAGKTGDATARTALDAVLMRRDVVTAGLARGEVSVRETLRPVGRELRRALGYPVPPLVSPGAPAEARL